MYYTFIHRNEYYVHSVQCKIHIKNYNDINNYSYNYN